jgi:hypothetical protein
MVKPKEFFNFDFPEQTTFLKNGLRKKTTPEHWALLVCSKVNGLFTQQDPERNKLAANYEAENLHMAFEQSSNMSDWKKYLQAHPPSPEALAVLVILGLEQFQSQKGRMAGHKSGVARRSKVKCKPEEVARLYKVYMANGTEERNIAAKLATRFSVTPNYIRNLRKQAKNKRD